ncbi:MAG TPA: BMC domain-containing protein [bacterium]|nr:BMC domain-containing protein [bacterium]
MTSLGLIELNSIAAGFSICDTLLKTANVELVLNRTICSGKYMIIVNGSVAAVQASIAAGRQQWPEAVIDSMVIANVHPSVLPALAGTHEGAQTGSLGVIESFSVASLLEAADAAAKAADVTLLEIRLAMALGGKAFVTLTGQVSAVRAAVEAGAALVAEKGLLVNKVVIPAPAQQLYQNYI